MWLAFVIYLESSFKAALPQHQVPPIIFGSIQVASLTSAVRLSRMARAITSEVTLLETFVVGAALALGVGLLLPPTFEEPSWTRQNFPRNHEANPRLPR